MKKIQTKKLSLTTEQIRRLGDAELRLVEGGALPISKIVRCGSDFACQ
jgi:hypothetical protein